MRISAFAVCAALVLALCAPARAETSGFYSVPAGAIAGRPGTIIRAEPFKAPPNASSAWRVVYRSTSASGKPIAVSGVIVVPSAPAPAGGRAIVSWAHATSGIATSCARSLYSSLYTHMYGLQEMLAKGMVVAATDYPGLGVSGVHPYLIGAAQGHAVLDMARAARALPQAQAGNEFVAAGYSQGGHASLFAGQLARSYAPEMKLLGVAASAPPTDLGALIRETSDDPVGRVFATFALASWSQLYGYRIDSVIPKHLGGVVRNIASGCNLDAGETLKLMFIEQSFEREGFFKEGVDVTTLAPWKGLLAKNSTGAMPAGLPVFLAQGRSDRIVRPNVTQAYADKLCANGSRTALIPVKGGHFETGASAAKPMVAWIADRFAGKPAPSDCGTAPVAAAPKKKARAVANGETAKKAPAPAVVQKPNIPPEKRFHVVDAETERAGRGS